MNLKSREDLKGALREKFRTRYGSGAKGRRPDEMSIASSDIRREVDNFATNAHVSEANLGRLDRRLQQKACKGKGRGGDTVSAYSNSAASQRSRSLTSLGERFVNPNAQQENANANPNAYSWARLDEYAGFLHEQDALRQKIGTQALQRKMRMDLDHQVQEKLSRKHADDSEEEKYHQNSVAELERWKSAEEARMEEMRQKLQREKRDRDEQLAFNQKLKREADQQKKDEEAALVGKILRDMDAEQQKFERIKANTKAKMRKVFEENEKDQQQRRRDEKEKKEREAAAMREYNRLLDEQEEQRAQELADRMTRQKDLMDKLQANVAAAKQDAGNNDEMRANAQQQELDRHYYEAETVKMQRLKQMKLENQAYLLRQMQERDGQKRDERQLSSIQAEIMERDTQEYNEVERQKVINKRAILVENQKEVEKQISAKMSLQQAPDMSEVEIAMNKPLLNLVNRTAQSRDQFFPDLNPLHEEDDY